MFGGISVSIRQWNEKGKAIQNHYFLLDQKLNGELYYSGVLKDY